MRSPIWKDSILYGKLFASMYDGTLVDHWEALVTFQQMIVLADDVGVVDITAKALANRTGIPLEIIETGIKVLESPDPYSRTTDQEGRRIERLDEHRPWGWRIINYLKYRQRVNHEAKKQADRERIAKKREKKADVAKCRKVSQMSRPVADVAHTEVEVDKDTKKSADRVVSGKPKGDLAREKDFIKLWNDAGGVVKNRGSGLTIRRRATFRARLKEATWATDAAEAIKKFPLPCFDDPEATRDWKPTIEWFLKPDTAVCILEGNYDWTKSTGGHAKGSEAAEAHENREERTKQLARTKARAARARESRELQ